MAVHWQQSCDDNRGGIDLLVVQISIIVMALDIAQNLERWRLASGVEQGAALLECR